MFCTELDKNIRIIENFILAVGSGGRSPDASEPLSIFPKFSSCNFNFILKFAGRPPRQKLIIHCFQYKRGQGEKTPPEPQRKFKIFTAKSEDFYEILKEFNGK